MRWGAVAAGLAAYALALLALAPATLLDAGLAQASDGRLRLAQAQGSLWVGSGWIEVRDASGGAIARRAQWRVSPASLLRARLVLDVGIGDAGKPFAVTVTPSRLEVAGASLRLPAAVLGLGIAGLAPLRLSGDVLISIPALALERGRLQGNATLRWLAAGSALTTVAPLGDYEVRIEAAGHAAHAALSTLSGALQLEGKGTWSGASAPDYRATARIAAAQRDELAPLLRLIAVERGAGEFEISSRGAGPGS